MDIVTSTTYQSKALEKERVSFLNKRIKRQEYLDKMKTQRRY